MPKAVVEERLTNSVLGIILDEIEARLKKETDRDAQAASKDVSRLRGAFHRGSEKPKYAPIADRLRKYPPKLPVYDPASKKNPDNLQKARIRLVLFLNTLGSMDPGARKDETFLPALVLGLILAEARDLLEQACEKDSKFSEAYKIVAACRDKLRNKAEKPQYGAIAARLAKLLDALPTYDTGSGKPLSVAEQARIRLALAVSGIEAAARAKPAEVSDTSGSEMDVEITGGLVDDDEEEVIGGNGKPGASHDSELKLADT